MAIYKELVRKISVPSDKKIKQKAYLKAGSLPVIDQGHSLIGGYTNDITKAIECDYPVIVFGDHTKCVKFITFPFAPGADGIKVLGPKQGVLPKYLYYGTQYLTFRIENKGYARHYQHIEKKELAVPPVPEQERIVSRIEELFSNLDASVAELQTAKEKLKVYRQAVLKEAFDRVANYPQMTIQDICDSIVDCPHSTPKWTEFGKICLRTTNFKRGHLDLTSVNYVSEETFAVRNSRLTPLPGDILYSREGAILGIACIIPSGLSVCLGQRMMLLRTNQNNSNYFLMHYLNSPAVTNFVAGIAGGSASPHINVRDIKNFLIHVPDLNTQKNIVLEIEQKLSICDDAIKSIDFSICQAEALRQSILKQAFEGRL